MAIHQNMGGTLSHSLFVVHSTNALKGERESAVYVFKKALNGHTIDGCQHYYVLVCVCGGGNSLRPPY